MPLQVHLTLFQFRSTPLGNILSINQSLLGKMNLGGWGPVSFSAGDRIARGLRAWMLLHGRTSSNVELTPGCVNRRRAREYVPHTLLLCMQDELQFRFARPAAQIDGAPPQENFISRCISTNLKLTPTSQSQVIRESQSRSDMRRDASIPFKFT